MELDTVKCQMYPQLYDIIYERKWIQSISLHLQNFVNVDMSFVFEGETKMSFWLWNGEEKSKEK